MKTYQVKFYPIIAIVENAKSKKEAEEMALERYDNGEYKVEVEKVEEDN